MHIILTILVFSLIVSVLIFVHELGHFLAAKAAKMKVEEFSVGFRPAIFEKKIGETNYVLGLIPMGGYVKIFGENPGSEIEAANFIKDDKEREKRLKEIEESKGRAFGDKNRLWQAIVLTMGIIFNFIFGYLIFLFMVFSSADVRIGDVSDVDQKYLVDKKLVISDIEKNSNAYVSGLLEKQSEIYAMKIDGNEEDILSKNFFNDIEKAKKNIEISYYPKKILTEDERKAWRRGDEMLEIKSVTLPVEYDDDGNREKFGIYFVQTGSLELPLLKNFEYAWKSFQARFQEIFYGIKKIFSGKAKMDDMAGPIGIAKVSGQAVEYGFDYVLMLLALLSINLGIINILPFPALDGGRLFMVILESVFRRKIPEKISNVINLTGFLILIILMIYITYKDIMKL